MLYAFLLLEFLIIFLEPMPQIHLGVPQNSYTWLEPNAHASSFVLLSFRTWAEIPVSQSEIFWQDIFKGLCRPLNPWSNSLITLPSNTCELSFRSWLFLRKETYHTHSYTQRAWKITEMAELISISHYCSYLKFLYKYKLRISTFTRCINRINKQMTVYKG